MTREEEIIEAANKYSEYEYNESTANNGFIKGAEWADNNPNLSSLWHDASEEPQENMDTLFISKNGNVHKASKIDNQLYDWLKNTNGIKKWLYVKDILPKE